MFLTYLKILQVESVTEDLGSGLPSKLLALQILGPKSDPTSWHKKLCVW